MPIPAIPELTGQLAMHVRKQSYNSTTFAANLNLFATAWGWTPAHVDNILKGKAKPTDQEIEFFREYLLQRFFDYNCI